ncbi:Stk1 family PASTA domain-containing Ser/Thr kinase [Leucobacter sp. GX0328]
MIGQTLDERYAIRSRIARGGMAMVYLAHDLRLERRVAVKVMHAHLAEDENFTRRFEQEARSAAGLSHANLVSVLDQGHDAGRTYLVMEYLPSITLRHLLKQQKRLTTEQALEIGEAVLSGLAAAHGAGIVHRDLKPENVLLADDGRIKLGDFGLARAVSANTTTGQALLGTIAYLSPELVTRGVADARSDLYAFGIMLYEMLTGEQPFTGEQPMQIAYQHAHSDVPVPSLKSPESTPELDEFVRWTTQRDPELRPRDAGEALEHLAAIRQGSPLTSTRVLPYADETSVLATPATAVLAPAQRELLAEDPAASQEETGRIAPAPATERARSAGRARAVRGRVIALVVVLLVLLAGGVGWWFGLGPGSQATVPEVTGAEVDAAVAALAEARLEAEVFDCSSLDVAAGLAARTEPEAGTRLDRGSTVRLCRSSGPEQIAVPTLVGLTVDEAERAITDAGFTFGSVIEQRFGAEAEHTVVAALDSDGAGLGETYAEQGRVDLIASAGPLPDVAGLKPKEAESVLSAAGLTLDQGLREEAYDAQVPEDRVIALIPTTDPVRPGDAVGLRVSLGPELFPVPDVSGMGLQEAMDALAQAGFSPSTLVPDSLRPLARASGTDPKAGEEVPAGTAVRVKAALDL